MTNATGSICFSADYYPYGQENAWCASRMVLRDDYDTSCLPTYRFTGYEYDSETGNAFFASRTDLRSYYAYARYYSPRLGRFMSPDPLGGSIQNPQSLNRYAYVLNDPETFIDPTGLTCHNHYGDVVPCNDPPPPPPAHLASFWDFFRFLSEATGMNGCGILWCTPNPPPDSNLYLLKLPGNLPRTRPQLPRSQAPTTQPKIGPAPKTPYVPPLWVNCSVYRDGTGAGATLYDICMGFPDFPTKSWAYCVRGKLLQQYVPNGNPAQLAVYLFWDHPYDFLTCPMGPGR